MKRYVIRLVAFDLILWIVLTRVVDVSLIVSVARMYSDDTATDVTGFGIPGHMVSDFE